MPDIVIEAAKKSWADAPDEHLKQAIESLENYDQQIRAIIIKEAENRFGEAFVAGTINKSISQLNESKSYGGIRRREFFLGWLGLLVFYMVLGLIFPENEVICTFLLLIALAVMGGLIIARLENIGRNWKWCLLLPVPIANFFVVVPCMMFPEGYCETHHNDAAGKIIGAIIAGVSVLVIIWIIIEFLTG